MITNERKKDTIDEPIFEHHISKDKQWWDTREGVILRKDFFRRIVSIHFSGSRADILKLFPTIVLLNINLPKWAQQL